MVLSLGVDYLQGYFLARPAKVPPSMNPEARKTIQRFAEQEPAENAAGKSILL